MTTTINASTSSGLVVTPDNSGNVVLQYNGVSGPAFSVYSNADQATTVGVWAKIAFQVEEYDTANCFDTTNYRFTPTVAGYYQINGSYYSNGGPSRTLVSIYKNGAEYKTADYATLTYAIFISTLVYLNGTTDYVETWMNNIGSGIGILANPTRTYMSGCLLRGA
jgi:hypothetical protein